MEGNEGEVLGAKPELSRHLLEGHKLLSLSVHILLVYLHSRMGSAHFSAEHQGKLAAQ